MAPPEVSIYVTSLTSQAKVRAQSELLRRSLTALEIPYKEYDLVNEPEAKTRWQRAKPPGVVVGLPGYLVGGEWVGTMEDFESAVEGAYLPEFLKQDIDLSLPSGDNTGNTSASVGEAELERLMREMTADDLNALAAEVGVEETKVGLIVPEGSIPVEAVEGEKTITIGDTTASPVDVSKGVNPVESKAETKATSPGVVEGAKEVVSSASEMVKEAASEAKQTLTDVIPPTPPQLTSSQTSAKTTSSQNSQKPSSQTTSATSTASLLGGNPDRPRRLSKEQIAEEMRKADSIDSLWAAVGMAGRKDKQD